MILKILKKDTEWLYLDKIKSISVDVPRDFALTSFEDKEKKQKWLEVCGLSTCCNAEDEREIVDSHKHYIDEYIFNHHDILKQAVFDDKGKRNFWGVKILIIIYENGKDYSLATLRNNENIFLLNDKGETIERL